MKPILFPVLLLVFAVMFSSCDDELTELQTGTFVKMFGSYRNDAGNDVKALSSGGFAVAGTMVPDSVAKMVLILTDEAGNQLPGSPFWFGGEYQTGGSAILTLADGYLLGGQLIDTTAEDRLESDIYIVRTDAEGNELWSRRIGGEGNDGLSHMAKGIGGGYVIAGKKNLNGNDDLWIILVDENGDLLFDFTGSDAEHDDQAEFALNTGTGYLVACTYDEGSLGGTDILIASLDKYCNVTDTWTFGTGNNDIARSIVRYNDGYLAMGYSENPATGLNQVVLYSFTVEADLIKNGAAFATISMTGADLTGEDCVVSQSGEIIVFGTMEVNENRDMALLRINEEGGMVADPETYGALGNQTGNALDKTPDGGLILVGNNTLEGNSLISLIKTNAQGGL